MLRKELLDARKALRTVSEGVSGPRSKKQRGEWELVSIQYKICATIAENGLLGILLRAEVREGSHCCREL